MTVSQFSDQFDALVNSYRRFRDFDVKEALDTLEFNEYEKSLFLTKAQEEVVIGLYSGRNIQGESFEETEELRRYLVGLVMEAELSPAENTDKMPLGMENISKFFKLPEDLWFITYERALCAGETCEYKANQEVYPVRQDEYNRLRKNPFRGVNDRRALRLDLKDGIAEIISKYGVTSYYIRYIRKVKPIVLVDLPDGLSIEEETKATSCELHESLHQRILDVAVRMALQSKGITLAASQHSE